MCILKLAGPTRFVIGTDFAVTLCFLGGFFLWTIIMADFHASEFRTLLCVHLNSKLSAKMRWRYNVISSLQVLIYFCCTVVPTFAILFLDKSEGPVENDTYALLVGRNMGMLVYILCFLIGTLHLTSEFRVVLKSIVHVQSARRLVLLLLLIVLYLSYAVAVVVPRFCLSFCKNSKELY